MTTVLDATTEELHAERSRILTAHNLTYGEFKHRAESYALVGNEWKAWGDLRAIDFLLGD